MVLWSSFTDRADAVRRISGDEQHLVLVEFDDNGLVITGEGGDC